MTQEQLLKKEQEKVEEEQELKEKVLVIFQENWKVYGTRRIKDALKKANLTISRRRLGRFMNELGIVSKYTQTSASYKPLSTPPNEESVQVKVFHTDRGSEFKNVRIDELLSKYKIKRSLSQKGNPYDNAVVEATFKILKIELING